MHLIEREIEDFDTAFLRKEEALAQLGRDQLSRDELAILKLVKHRVSNRCRGSIEELVRMLTREPQREHHQRATDGSSKEQKVGWMTYTLRSSNP